MPISSFPFISSSFLAKLSSIVRTLLVLAFKISFKFIKFFDKSLFFCSKLLKFSLNSLYSLFRLFSSILVNSNFSSNSLYFNLSLKLLLAFLADPPVIEPPTYNTSPSKETIL